MSTTVTEPEFRAAVAERRTTVVVTREKGGTPAVTPQSAGRSVVVRYSGAAGGGAPADALLVANRLSEFSANPAAQLAAQQNIGLGSVDPLAYYILAKA